MTKKVHYLLIVVVVIITSCEKSHNSSVDEKINNDPIINATNKAELNKSLKIVQNLYPKEEYERFYSYVLFITFHEGYSIGRNLIYDPKKAMSNMMRTIHGKTPYDIAMYADKLSKKNPELIELYRKYLEMEEKAGNITIKE